MSTSGYERLVQAGRALTCIDTLAAESPPAGQVARFLDANREVLAAAREALQQECAVPLEWHAEFFNAHTEAFSALQSLACSFALDFTAAELRGDLERATDVGLDLVDLAGATRRGGLIVDALVADAVEGIAIERLRGVRQRLPPEQAVRLANGLLDRERAREPFATILARDARWEEAVDDAADEEEDESSEEWLDEAESEEDLEARKAILETLQQLAARPAEEHHGMQRRLDARNLALLRLLALEAALVAHRAWRDRFPTQLAELIPRCVDRLPLDPFTGQPFLYRMTAHGFVLYSPGPTGQDAGGRPGGWLSIEAGQADLCVDMWDYSESCYVTRPTPL